MGVLSEKAKRLRFLLAEQGTYQLSDMYVMIRGTVLNVFSNESS